MTEPTPQDLRSAGFALPDGMDMISEGDDAIRANAYAAFNLRPIKGVLPENTDLAGWRGVGWHRIPSTSQARTITGLPVEERGAILGIPLGNDHQSWARIFVSVTSNRAWYQAMDTAQSGGGTYAWFPWVELTNTSQGQASDYAPAPALRDALLARHGGSIGTQGKGVVALRIDHNMRGMTDKLLPMLEARGIPASQCHFVEEMDPQPHYTGDDSTGSSWTEVQHQAIHHGIEVWSHGWTHTDQPAEGLAREIIESKDELEAVMPKVPVTGFMVPGVTGSRWDGFGNQLDDPAVWHTTLAGRMITATYPTANGQGSVLNSLTGSPGYGWTSYSIDTASSASAQALIDHAIDTNMGVIFMIHPRVIDEPNSISSADLESILDYIAEKRDTQELDVLTVSGLLCADPGHNTRYNIVRDPAFTQSGRWAGRTGWTIIDGTATASADASTLNQPHSISRIRHLSGGVWEAAITVDANTPATVELGVTIDDTLITKTYVHPGSDHPVAVRIPFTIPLGASLLTLQISVITGTATVSAPRITPL